MHFFGQQSLGFWLHGGNGLIAVTTSFVVNIVYKVATLLFSKNSKNSSPRMWMEVN